MARRSGAPSRALRPHLSRSADVLELEANGRRARHESRPSGPRRRLHAVLATDGLLVFSTNAQKFKLDPALSERYDVQRHLRGDDPAGFRAQSAHPSVFRHPPSRLVMRLSDFKALTFDCYGTLIDWETGLLAALRGLIGCAPRRRSSEEVLNDYAVHEAEQEHFTPTMKYSQLLAVVYKRLAENWEAPAPWQECSTFGTSLRSWEPFPDTVEALRYLKNHYKLYILSNVDNESFSFTASEARRAARWNHDGRRHRLVQAQPAELRIHARAACAARASRSIRSCTWRRA